MNKKIFFLVCLILSTIVFSFNVSYANAGTPIQIYINDSLMNFKPGEPLPYIKEGRVLIPFRKIFEEVLDMEVMWDPEKYKVTAINANTEIVLYINNTTAYVNKSEKELDIPAEIIEGRTFVPLRFVSENCGADVSWNDKTKSVLIKLNESVNITKINKNLKLGKEVLHGDLLFSLDSIRTESSSVSYDKKLSIQGLTNTKNAKLYLEIFNSSGISIKSKTYTKGSSTGIYETTAITYTSKGFVPHRICVYVYENENLVLVAEYQL